RGVEITCFTEPRASPLDGIAFLFQALDPLVEGNRLRDLAPNGRGVRKANVLGALWARARREFHQNLPFGATFPNAPPGDLRAEVDAPLRRGLRAAAWL